MLGIADVDTRAITRALRQTGCLNGVICTDASKSDDELLEQARSWSILGKDLISEVSDSGAISGGASTAQHFRPAGAGPLPVDPLQGSVSEAGQTRNALNAVLRRQLYSAHGQRT